MKGKLIIHNVGPIKDVTIDLNKINVIIGKQGSGKSTIAKLISFFAWVEKTICTKNKVEHYSTGDNLYEKLVSFHKLYGYFSEDSHIHYESKFITVDYSYNKEPQISVKDKIEYKRLKIAYVPSERNIVATIPNWFDVKFPENNILSFMSDWDTAHKLRTKDHPIAIGNINYFYDEDSKINFIAVDGKLIELTNAASGFQSVIPMLVVAEYVAKFIYEIEENISVNDKKNKDLLIETVFSERISDVLSKQFESEKLKKLLKSKDNIESVKNEIYNSTLKLAKQYVDNVLQTQKSKLIIEEPEQNLFPQTQRDIIYRLLNMSKDERVSLTLTTHSPYVLYAINNCIIGGLVKDNMPGEISNKLPSKPYWIDPHSVSIWQITDKGGIEPVQNEKNRTLKSQFLNTSMNEVMNEYFTMLKYLK